jgi:hypothetical protein
VIDTGTRYGTFKWKFGCSRRLMNTEENVDLQGDILVIVIMSVSRILSKGADRKFACTLIYKPFRTTFTNTLEYSG